MPWPIALPGWTPGADDYLAKPFSFDELLARDSAPFCGGDNRLSEDELTFADLRLNPNTHEVFRGDRAISLTAREFELLLLFMQNPRQVLTRDVLYDRIWGYDFGGESNIIEVYIRYLRSKLEEKDEPRLIQTVRGVGYVLRQEDSRKGDDGLAAAG